MNFKKVFFRVDASLSIGSGHIMRCLTLGNEFIKKRKKVFILYEENYTILFKKFGSRKIVFKKIKSNKNLKVYKKILDHNSILILDNYNINFIWEKKIKKLVYKLIVIDDLANKKHDCDILIDQNFKRKKGDYRNLVPKNCKILVGINYVIIRDEFIKNKKRIINKKHILISLGNYDPNFAAYKCLMEVLKKETGLKIIIIVSAKTKSYIKIKEIQNLYTFKIYNDINYISKLMNKSIISIGAGGTTSWERCFMGLPTIVVKLANNQNFIINELVKSKIIYYAGNIKSNNLNISKGIDYFLNKKNYNVSINKSKKLIDGLGKKRIINEISKI